MLTINQGESTDVLELDGRFDGIGAAAFDEFVGRFESRSRPRNIVYDFARLEPLLSIQLTRLEKQDDLSCLLEFLVELMEKSPLSSDPPFRYNGTDPMVEKAWRLICVLRHYARRVTDGEDQPMFYWIPLLHWTLPIVCFGQLELERKRLSMYAAGLICSRAWTRIDQ